MKGVYLRYLGHKEQQALEEYQGSHLGFQLTEQKWVDFLI
jgi:hypothetical protein